MDSAVSPGGRCRFPQYLGLLSSLHLAVKWLLKLELRLDVDVKP